LAGNYLDREAVERALLRRQARQLQRVKDQNASWRGHEALWVIAPPLPPRAHQGVAPQRPGPGCYWVEPPWQRFLWIAANELPLVDELIPFLLARSGQALDTFCRWVAPRRPYDWVLTMLECLPMSMLTQEELLWRFGKAEDPEVEARRQRILDFLLETSPQKKQQLRREGQLEGRLTEASALVSEASYSPWTPAPGRRRAASGAPTPARHAFDRGWGSGTARDEFQRRRLAGHAAPLPLRNRRGTRGGLGKAGRGRCRQL